MKIKLCTIEDVQSDEFARIIESLKFAKEEAVALGDEERANDCWREIEALEINSKFIRAFNDIKNNKYRDAWSAFERCEIGCKLVEENSTEEFIERSRVGFIKRLVEQWQFLFPYCLFVSPAYVVGYYTCSICGHKIRPRSRCGHRKGKIYWGEICVHVIHDLEVREISLVTRPVQKYSVVHDDERLDFTIIEHLSALLDHAFEDWRAKWTTMKFPIERFNAVSPDDECPCESGEKFQSCCMNKAEVEIPHVDFLLSKELSEHQQGTRFPYDG